MQQAPRSALSALANINANRFDDAALKANVDESTYERPLSWHAMPCRSAPAAALRPLLLCAWWPRLMPWPRPASCTNSYAAFHASVTDGSTLPKPAAKDLANSLMKWATDRGAVNYAHWFFPMRGMKAGVKQDAFISLDFGHENVRMHTRSLAARSWCPFFSAPAKCVRLRDLGSAQPHAARQNGFDTHLRIRSRAHPRTAAPKLVLFLAASQANHHRLQRQRHVHGRNRECTAIVPRCFGRQALLCY